MIADKPAKLQPSANQHLRLRLDQIKLHYQDGLITASGLLYYAIGIMRPPGKGLSLQPKEWMSLTGLKRSTFFHAKAKLVAQGWLKEDVADSVEIELAHAPKVLDGSFQVVEETESPPLKKDADLLKGGEKQQQTDESKMLDLPSNILDPESNVLDSESSILDPESNVLDKREPEAVLVKCSSIAPDITDKADKAAPQSAALSACKNEEEEAGGPNEEEKSGPNIPFAYEQMLEQAEKELASTEKMWKRAAIAKRIKAIKERLVRANSEQQQRLKSHALYAVYSFEGASWEDAARRFGHSESAIAEFKDLLSSCK